MRKFAAVIVLAACLAVAHLPAEAGSADVANPQLAGEIHGVAEFCGERGPAGSLVYVPGDSTMAKLGTNGTFRLRHVTEGTHNVVLEDAAGRVLLTLSGVEVERKRINDLGPIVVCPDLDADGFDQAVDCDDLNASIYPSAQELCDGVDNNCDGRSDEGCVNCTDADQDLFFAQSACGTLVDCDDGDAAIHPTAVEVCDGVDNNCDQAVDEGFDADGDGFTVCGGDCDDASSLVFPGATEVCDTRDNDCDGQVDELGGDPCDGADADLCEEGIFECVDFSLVCSDATGDNQELCNGVDDDCDGGVDEGCLCIEGETQICGTSDVGECSLGVQACDSSGQWGTCEGSVDPSPEACDGLDNDCDGAIDDDGTDDCVAQATCFDTEESFQCVCPGGYQGDGRASGSGCVDINECVTGLHDCADQDCTNLPGGWACG